MLTYEKANAKLEELILQFPGQFYEGPDFINAVEDYAQSLLDDKLIEDFGLSTGKDFVSFMFQLPNGTNIEVKRQYDGGVYVE